MAATMKENVDLGFLEKTTPNFLLSHQFPSKVGSKPAWLSLSPLPTPEELTCSICGKPCVFLLQIYAPDSENYSCFHRTVFVFICKDPLCSQKNDRKSFRVLRSQLPKVNDFYSQEPPLEDEAADDDCAAYPNAAGHQNLCIICGCHGPKTCAKCRKVHYCGKDHQTVHWKSGHKTTCGQEGQTVVASYLFPEFEVVMETEQYKEVAIKEKSEEEKMKEYEKFMAGQVGKSTMTGKEVDSDLMKMAFNEEQEDKAFKRFKKRIEPEPEQVLRYNRGGDPLWVSNENIPSQEDIPKCDCGATRTFEFQVLPQLLNHLDVTSVGDSIDWGTLLIYTCSANCDIKNDYHPEFLWKQDFSADEA
ncbi:programmed cell death protein 2-like [Lineus longissimus]|uniref:programmed cell death protein 2-like n=1 Tax=Lineus longissimus TaxID=88925 RepID=UPI00315C7E0A